MLDTIRAKRNEIYAIARKDKAEKLWVFGSVARKEERPDSDVDFLVEFEKSATRRSRDGRIILNPWRRTRGVIPKSSFDIILGK